MRLLTKTEKWKRNVRKLIVEWLTVTVFNWFIWYVNIWMWRCIVSNDVHCVHVKYWNDNLIILFMNIYYYLITWCIAYCYPLGELTEFYKNWHRNPISLDCLDWAWETLFVIKSVSIMLVQNLTYEFLWCMIILYIQVNLCYVMSTLMLQL